MNMLASNFSLKRIWSFIVYKLACQLHSLLISTGGAIGIIFFAFLIYIWKGGSPESFDGFVFPILLMLGGVIITCRIFTELRSPAQTLTFLTLPVSNVEKWVGAWLISTVGVTLGFFLLMWVFSLIGNSLYLIFYPDSMTLTFSPFSSESWDMIKGYFFIHSFFFLGAASFRKNVFFRTVFSIFLVFLGILVISGLLVSSFDIQSVFQGSFDGNAKSQVMRFMSMADTKIQTMGSIGDIFETYFLAPYLWVVAFFKIKEREL